uniref:C2H2-type domain-containing protein n=1 Tax=Panagrellus redivivus TaxID=6233 RepID=A0A7E4ZXH3_PANRE
MSTASDTASGQGPPNYMDPYFTGDGFDGLGTAEIYSMLCDDQQQLDGGFGGIDDLQLTADAYLSSLTESGTASADSAIFSANSGTAGPPSPSNTASSGTVPPTSPGGTNVQAADAPPPPSPVVIDPNEIDKISVTLEKNQQCRCKSCNKLFNSVWYLKQHAVKHSNDRPFKCKFCLKTYKFRSNLYQHKCPERNRQLGGPNGIRKRFYTRGIAYTEVPKPDGADGPANGEQTGLNAIQALDGVNTNMENTQPFNPDNGFSNGFANQAPPQAPPPTQPIPQFELIPVEAPPLPQPENVVPKVEVPPLVPNSIRVKQLDPAFIEDYLQRKKHKLHTCRKCRFQFPSRAHLAAHMTAHNLADAYCYCCPQCPQKFTTEQRLLKHLELHATIQSPVPHFCRQCGGAFRSQLALRRHVDQSRICYSYPFGEKPKLMTSPFQLYDPYSFIESDDEGDQHSDSVSVKELAAEVTRHNPTTDSGVGSDTSSHTTSPRQLFNLLEDEFDEKLLDDQSEQPARKRSKKTSENSSEDADSGFRSRLNSHASCSPSSSAFSMGSASPPGSSTGTGSHRTTPPGHVDYSMPGPSGMGNSCFSGARMSEAGGSSMPSMSYGELSVEIGSDHFFDELSHDDGSTITAKRGKLLDRFKLTLLKPSMPISLPELESEEVSSPSFSSSGSGEAPIATPPPPQSDHVELPCLKAIIAVFLDTLIKLASSSVSSNSKNSDHC